MYLDKGSLLPVVNELGGQSRVNKRRTTKKGIAVGGRSFDKATLYTLLKNPILIGKIKHKDNIYEGEHDAIVDQELLDKVQDQLSLNGRSGGIEVRKKYGALLRGLLPCKTCNSMMTHTFSGSKKKHYYRYYRCVRAIKSGCPWQEPHPGEQTRIRDRTPRL